MGRSFTGGEVMGRSKNIWHNYYTYCESSFTVRGGTVACRVLPPFKVHDAFPYDKKPEFVSEHMGRSAFLLGQILMNYPELTDPKTWFLQMMFLLCHDAGEYKFGDILDDGSISGNAVLKEAKYGEIEILDEMFCNFPDRFGMEMCNMLPLFESYSGKMTLLDKMTEKLDAILFQLFLYSKGVSGSVKAKEPEPSERDMRFAEILGTARAIDVWTLHYRVTTKDAPREFQEPLRKILKVAFQEVYLDVPKCMTIDVADIELDIPLDNVG